MLLDQEQEVLANFESPCAPTVEPVRSAQRAQRGRRFPARRGGILAPAHQRRAQTRRQASPYGPFVRRPVGAPASRPRGRDGERASCEPGTQPTRGRPAPAQGTADAPLRGGIWHLAWVAELLRVPARDREAGRRERQRATRTGHAPARDWRSTRDGGLSPKEGGIWHPAQVHAPLADGPVLSAE